MRGYGFDRAAFACGVCDAFKLLSRCMRSVKSALVWPQGFLNLSCLRGPCRPSRVIEFRFLAGHVQRTLARLVPASVVFRPFCCGYL